jgi:glycerophosphoryl diester phosphodiesterase
MKIICNRISRLYPNSIYGFIHNLNMGFTSFEIDLNTCINEVILYNYDYFNGKHIKYLHKQNFCLDGKYCVNTFMEFIDVLNNYNNLDIFFDIKGSDIDIIEYIYFIYPRLNTNNQYFFQSYNYNFLKKLKRKIPSINCGLLVNGYIPIKKKMLKYIDFFCIKEDFIHCFSEYGKDIYLWNIIYNNDIINYKNAGVKGIITNYPENFQ